MYTDAPIGEIWKECKGSGIDFAICESKSDNFVLRVFPSDGKDFEIQIKKIVSKQKEGNEVTYDLFKRIQRFLVNDLEESVDSLIDFFFEIPEGHKEHKKDRKLIIKLDRKTIWLHSIPFDQLSNVEKFPYLQHNIYYWESNKTITDVIETTKIKILLNEDTNRSESLFILNLDYRHWRKDIFKDPNFSDEKNLDRKLLLSGFYIHILLRILLGKQYEERVWLDIDSPKKSINEWLTETRLKGIKYIFFTGHTEKKICVDSISGKEIDFEEFPEMKDILYFQLFNCDSLIRQIGEMKEDENNRVLELLNSKRIKIVSGSVMNISLIEVFMSLLKILLVEKDERGEYTLATYLKSVLYLKDKHEYFQEFKNGSEFFKELIPFGVYSIIEEMANNY